MKKKYVIFGATGAVGSALANQLYNDKLDCHLIGRNKDEINKLAKKLNYTYSVCDVMRLDFTNNLKKEAKKYLDIFKDHPYIFNLGHGILPETNPDMVDYLVKMVKDY